MKKLNSIIILAVIMTITSCIGPYKVEKYKDIGTNETGFLVPLEAGTKDSQKMLKSIDYLEQKKVAAKRVSINQRKRDTGRWWWEYEYIPTDTLIVVHRAPVTREWSDAKKGVNQILSV